MKALTLVLIIFGCLFLVFAAIVVGLVMYVGKDYPEEALNEYLENKSK